MPPGLKDVAARTGVSIKTVSTVVNGYVHVAPATRARVRAAIEAPGHVPNPAARQLRVEHRLIPRESTVGRAA